MAAESITDEEAIAQSLLSRDNACIENHVVAAEIDSTDGLATALLIFGTVIAILGSFVFGTTVGFSSPAQSGIISDLGLTLAQYSFFGSILTIGAMIGALFSGKIADYIGRRATMGVAELICIAGWLAIIFGRKAWLLDVGRFTTGFASGMLSYVVPVYIAEITPKNLRGAFTALNQLLITTGASAMYVIGNFIAWRILAAIGTIACVLQLLGLFFIPESPRWLGKIGSWKDSYTSLQRLRGKNADISEEAAEIRDYTEAINTLSESRIIDLFDRKYAHALIVGMGLMVLQQLGGINAIGFYASSIFVSAGFSSKIGTIAIVVIQIPTNILGTLLLDRVGRKPILLVSSIGTCLGTFLIGLSFLLQALNVWKFSPLLALIGAMLYMGSFALGMGGIPWIIMSEIFPINVKGVAGSLVTAVVWLFSWIVSYSYNFLTKWITPEGTYFCFSIIAGLTPVFVVKLVPETKGRTLEEIQASTVLFSRKQ